MAKKTFENIISNLLGEPTSNLCHAFYDQYVEANVRIRSKLGMKELIIRRQLGKCCKWCADLAGIYSPENAPADIYRRHDNCKCMVTYKDEDGYTDVWSKKEFQGQKEARLVRERKLLKERTLYKEIYDNADGRGWKNKVNSMRREQYAANKDAINEQKRVAYMKRKTLANGGENDIISARGINSRLLANNRRSNRFYKLTTEDIKSVSEDAAAINVPVSILKFNNGFQTGFDEISGIINIRGDIFPDVGSKSNRDLLSVRCVLAHEYYGHYKSHPSSFKVGDWRDEFRASYKASINTPNLSDEERRMLMIDAYDRAKEAGVSVSYNSIARRIIHGYD